MSRSVFYGVMMAALLSAGCAQQQVSEADMPKRGDPSLLKMRDSIADEVYINPVASAELLDKARRIYIAPLNTSSTQIFQPPGVSDSDLDAWVMTPEEDNIIQNKMLREFTRELEVGSSFSVVNRREEADVILFSHLIAVHPNLPRSVAESGKGGGALTMSFAYVDRASGTVIVRMLDSKSTDNIWAFHHVADVSALDLIFSAWGDQMRRGLLYLQGRYVEPLQMRTPVLKEG